MAGTHTFELDVDSVQVEGEIGFGSGGRIAFTSDVDVPRREFTALSSFFSALGVLYDHCGQKITKIEILLKP